MARLDYSAGTPLRAGDFVLMMPEYSDDRPDASYFIVRRAHIEPLFTALRQSGIPVRRVLFVAAQSVAAADRSSISQVCRPSLAARVGRMSTRAAAATAVLTLMALPAVAYWRNSAALAVVDQEIAVAERDVEAVRQGIEKRDRRIAEIAAARRAKSEAVPLVEVLEELARTLPDTTWLTDVAFEEGGVTFTGRSEAAVELIPSLESSPLFEAPTFSMPVVRDAEQEIERFTITLRMERAGG
jgi:general secretion pathway protein L